MKPFIQISLPTGHVYEITTAVIAQHRAKFYFDISEEGEFPTLEASLADTIEVFDDASEIRNWAMIHMDMNQLAATSRLVRFTAPSHDWQAADWSYHDHNAMMGELEADHIMSSPVEAVLSTMAASNQLCNVTVLNGDDSKPYAAMALIIGNEPIICTFVAALQFAGEHVSASLPKTFAQ